MFTVSFIDVNGKMREMTFDFFTTACMYARILSSFGVVHVYDENNELCADYFLGEEVDDL